jgi:hypothetical protein
MMVPTMLTALGHLQTPLHRSGPWKSNYEYLMDLIIYIYDITNILDEYMNII